MMTANTINLEWVSTHSSQFLQLQRKLLNQVMLVFEGASICRERYDLRISRSFETMQKTKIGEGIEILLKYDTDDKGYIDPHVLTECGGCK